jgi:FkbM family methyltransferase
MNVSRLTAITKIRTALSGTFLYRPTRYLYNKLLLFNAKQDVELNGLSLNFQTPTFKIADDLERFAEKDLLQSFLRAIRPFNVVWDVGANMGLYSLFASRSAGNEGRVLAFEPEPASRSLLKRNIKNNNIDNIEVLGCALDKENTTRELYPSATPNTGSHSLVQRTDYRVNRRGIRVTTYTGDFLVQNRGLSPPDILKIDVEGAEMNVLGGMGDCLRRDTLRVVLIEVHPQVLPLFGHCAEDVEQTIRSYGFSNIARIERGTEFHLLCSRT